MYVSKQYPEQTRMLGLEITLLTWGKYGNILSAFAHSCKVCVAYSDPFTAFHSTNTLVFGDTLPHAR